MPAWEMTTTEADVTPDAKYAMIITSDCLASWAKVLHAVLAVDSDTTLIVQIMKCLNYLHMNAGSLPVPQSCHCATLKHQRSTQHN